VLFESADKVMGVYSEEKTWPDKWILQHDNAPAHDALRFQKFLAKNSITKIDHPPHSPDSLLQFLALSEIKKCPEGTKIC